jgi:hypothetical protein
MMQACSVISKVDRLFVTALTLTEPGIWVATGPVVQVSDVASPNLLGAIIDLVLAETRYDVPLEVATAGTPAVVRAANAKTYSAVVRGARIVRIEREDGVVTLLPTRHRGRDAFDYLPDRSVTCARCGSEDLGLRLREALQRCEVAAK